MTGTIQAIAAGTDVARPLRTSNVARLRPREAMTFDQARLAEVCDGHGHRAEAYIACILDEVETQVAAAAARANDAGALGMICRNIVTLSEAIGMLTMEQAARAVLDCLDGNAGDAASAACLQRLLRLGHPTETGGWEMMREAEPETVA